MKIIGRDLLEVFCSRHADCRSWIEAWLLEVNGMSWARPQDIRDRYSTASFLQGSLVVFNVRGNNYRLEVHVAYRNSIVTVRWIGTHREYDERNRRR